MRTETITRNLYTFPELSEKAKETARNWWRDAAAHDDEWWGFIYDDAERVGLKIESFDVDRWNDIDGRFITSAVDCAEKIMEEYGDTCETSATARAFLKERAAFMETAEKDECGDLATYAIENALEEMEKEFLHDILQDYHVMLRRECEYYYGDEHVDECITINEYEFTEDGRKAPIIP